MGCGHLREGQLGINCSGGQRGRCEAETIHGDGLDEDDLAALSMQAAHSAGVGVWVGPGGLVSPGGASVKGGVGLLGGQVAPLALVVRSLSCHFFMRSSIVSLLKCAIQKGQVTSVEAWQPPQLGHFGAQRWPSPLLHIGQ